MNLIFPLLQREWFQHRFGWLMTALVPLLLVVLLLGFGKVEFDGDGVPPAQALAAIATALSVVGMTLLYTVTGLVTVVGLARRDHADRSVEFWLSLPIGHARSFAVPMLVHLVLVPLAAIALGLLIGALTSALLVSRVHGFEQWLALPWSDALQAAAAGLLRLWTGWPMAVLWLLPVVLVAMLLHAWMRRWGLVIFGLALALGNSPLGEWFGLHHLNYGVQRLLAGAARSFVSGYAQVDTNNKNSAQLIQNLAQASHWVLIDIWGSVRGLASPKLAAGLGVAALCFAGLVHWRRRGASTAV